MGAFMKTILLVLGMSLMTSAVFADAGVNSEEQIQVNCASDEYAVVSVNQSNPSVINYMCKSLDCVYVKAQKWPLGWFTQKYDIFLEKDGYVVGEAQFDNSSDPSRLAFDVDGEGELNSALQIFISKGVCKKAVDGGSVVPQI